MARPSFLDTLAVAPRWQKIVGGVVAVAALGAAAYFIGILPVQARVAALSSQRDTQQAELVRLRGLAAELTRVRREAADVERRLDVVKAKLPTQREIPALYRTLSDAAVQSGLAVGLFQPREPRHFDFYSEIPISLLAEGGYHEIGAFIGRVAALPRATMVGELRLATPKAEASRPPTPTSLKSIRSPTEDNRPRASVTDEGRPRRWVRADMTLLTYVYRPVGSPPPPKPAGAAAKPEPAKP